MSIRVKRNASSMIVALFADMLLLISVMELLLRKINYETIILALVIFSLGFYITELGFLHYSLDEEGLNQQFFFVTLHSTWSDFTNVSIVQGENAPKGIFVVCLNRGILDLGSQHVNWGLHPLRYHLIYLEPKSEEQRKNSKKLGITGHMNEEAFFRLMEKCEIHVCDAR